LNILKKFLEEIQVALQSDKNNNRHCTCSRPIYIFDNTEWHKKKGTFEKPNKNWRSPRKI